MNPVKIIQIHHPSGGFYEAWERFAAAHHESSFFQSPAFVRLIESSPGVEWVLLLAVGDEAMKDPGAAASVSMHGRIPVDTKQRQAVAPHGSKAERLVDPGNILASLLALIIGEEEPQAGLLRIFRAWHERLTTQTLVYQGPLLTPGTRLQQERTLSALLEALNRQVRKRSVCIQIVSSPRFNEFLPLFKDLGYNRRENPMRQIIIIDNSTETESGKQNSDRDSKKRISLENGVLTVHNTGMKQPDQSSDIVNSHAKEISTCVSDLICFKRTTRPFLHFLHLLQKNRIGLVNNG